VESFARVLSDRNRALLHLIAQSEPESLTELAALSGRAKSNLSRTLKTMERYERVRLKKGKRGKWCHEFLTRMLSWTCRWCGGRGESWAGTMLRD